MLPKLEHALHPYVAFGILPLFALSAAGVNIASVAAMLGGGAELDTSPLLVFSGVALGLLVGKPVGIALFVWLAERMGFAKRPEGVTWQHIWGMGAIAGVGFTMSLFVGKLAFEGAHPELLAAAREITANNWRTLAALGSASLIDRMPDMKDHALTVMTAIATEKAELLSGGATSRIEVIAAPAVDEWSDVVDGVVIESAVSIGNASRTRAPKGPTPPPPALADRTDGEQPPVSECSHTVDAEGVSVFEPVEAPFLPPPPPSDRGEEGVRSSSNRSLPNSLSDNEIFRKST
jgi:hypothetical protein